MAMQPLRSHYSYWVCPWKSEYFGCKCNRGKNSVPQSTEAKKGFWASRASKLVVPHCSPLVWLGWGPRVAGWVGGGAARKHPLCANMDAEGLVMRARVLETGLTPTAMEMG